MENRFDEAVSELQLPINKYIAASEAVRLGVITQTGDILRIELKCFGEINSACIKFMEFYDSLDKQSIFNLVSRNTPN